MPAVPAPPFADTGLADDAQYTYRVAAVVGAEYPGWNWSERATATSLTGAAGPVTVAVDAGRTVGRLHRVWRMVGSERLTQLRFDDDGHGNDVGREFAEALRIAHADLGADYVRAHAILHDDNNVVSRNDDGSLAFDFTVVDSLYDQIRELGYRPIVELSFMPAAIARDPDETVFEYRGIISPPREWSEWYDVVHALTAHLVERYGLDEVDHLGVRGVERAQPRGVLDGLAAGLPAPVRRIGTRREGRASRACGSAARRPLPPNGSRPSPRTPRKRASPSTSSPATPTATCRWTPAPRSGVTASRASRPGGPSGASGPRTTARSTTASSVPRSRSAGSTTCRAAWTHSPTG